MDPSIISGLSAVLGSVVGGAASITTAWFTQRTQNKRESINAEIERRESLYTQFIAECSKLAIDSLDRHFNAPATFVQVYALQNRIRLSSSDAVLRAAEETVRHIIAQYFQPELSPEELRATLQNPPIRSSHLAKRVGENCRACTVHIPSLKGSRTSTGRRARA
jgi:hypothetical protein